MISVLLSRLVLLVFGTLYPAYASYKTVKTKNVKDYVRWMMYWIVFALYTFVEIFADIFIAFWFPFYYELKIVFVLWLICPATRGSSYIFRRVINPQLSKHEKIIDSYIASFWDHGYDVARKIGAQGLDYVVEIFLELLHKGQITAVNFLPKINEVAQTESVIPSTSESASEQKPSEQGAVVEEEFDILMLENYDSCSDTYMPSPKNSQKESSESESELEDVPSVKSRPLKLSTRSKTKALAVKKKKKL